MAVSSVDIMTISELKELDGVKTYSESFLYGALYPLIMTMRCFGLYQNRHDGTGNFRTFTTLYTLVPAICILNTLARSCPVLATIEGFSLALFGALINLLWLIWTFFGFTMCYFAWYRRTQAPTFFASYNQVLHTCELKHVCFKSDLRRRTCIAIIIGMFCIAINVIFCSYLTVATEAFDTSLKAPVSVFYSFPTWGQTFATIVLTFNQVYLSAAWILPAVFQHCISYALRLELKSFNNAFSEDINDKGAFQGDIETYRLRHQVIANLITKADSMLGVQTSSSLMCSIGLVIFLLYSFLWDPRVNSNVASLLPYIYWIAMSTLFAGVVLYDGAQINCAAHESLSRLHDIKLQNHSNVRDLTELTMFLNKLSGPPIGLTAIGLFVIDKPTILTTIGMFLTYFVIVVQFRIPTGTPDTALNATLTS